MLTLIVGMNEHFRLIVTIITASVCFCIIANPCTDLCVTETDFYTGFNKHIFSIFLDSYEYFSCLACRLSQWEKMN